MWESCMKLNSPDLFSNFSFAGLWWFRVSLKSVEVRPHCFSELPWHNGAPLYSTLDHGRGPDVQALDISPSLVIRSKAESTTSVVFYFLVLCRRSFSWQITIRAEDQSFLVVVRLPLMAFVKSSLAKMITHISNPTPHDSTIQDSLAFVV